MKAKSKNFIIPLVIYPFDVMVSLGETNEQMDKQLDKYKLSSEDLELAALNHDTTQGRAVMFQGNQSLIRLRKIPVTNADYGNLQHEIFHCVTFIMFRIGMPLEINKSDEGYAYLVGYLTKEIYSKL